jgi:hypothetical protein
LLEVKQVICVFSECWDDVKSDKFLTVLLLLLPLPLQHSDNNKGENGGGGDGTE